MRYKRYAGRLSRQTLMPVKKLKDWEISMSLFVLEMETHVRNCWLEVDIYFLNQPRNGAKAKRSVQGYYSKNIQILKELMD